MLRKPTDSLLIWASAAMLVSTTSASGPSVNEAGFTCINGSAFIPVGVYDVNRAEDALSVRRAGLNCAESMLADIRRWDPEAGLGYIHWMIARMKSDQEIADLARSGMADPWNLAWYTFDEPNEVGVSPSRCREVYAIIKELDPDRPVMLTVSPAYWYHPWAYSDYADACDILSTDPYPIEIGHGIGIDYVSEAIQRARGDSGKPVWAVLQAFPWQGKRPPTPEELRCMTYQALIHGASGVLYYTYQVAAWNYTLLGTPLWGEIGTLAQEISVLNNALTSPGPEATVSSGIHACERRLGNSTCIIAVNVEPRETLLEYPLYTPIHSIDVVFENRVLEASDGILRDHFGPCATHVYCMGEGRALGLIGSLVIGCLCRQGGGLVKHAPQDAFREDL